jgi:hypothetical protein
MWWSGPCGQHARKGAYMLVFCAFGGVGAFGIIGIFGSRHPVSHYGSAGYAEDNQLLLASKR